MDQDEVRRALAAADAAYEPFAPFSAWTAEPIATGSWDDAAAHLATVREAAPVEAVDAALDEVLRAAAVDTGAIEGLYRADRGFTRSVARNVISLDQAEVEAGLGFRRSFEAQLAGFELALRLAIGDEVITEAAIREVHRVTCADDSTYRVLTEHGIQERELVLGAYKTETNHVELADGTWHAYAPVDSVTDEVHRLVEEMRSSAFRDAHPVVQAAFVHHAFTSVHPFADGNGRVARLLASIPLLRATSIPLWVEVSDRPRYIDALEAADQGDRQPFLRLVTSVTLSLLRELVLAIPAAPEARPEPSDAEAAAALTTATLVALEARIADRSDLRLTHPSQHATFVPEGVMTHLDLMTWVGNDDQEHLLMVGIAPDADEWSRILLYVAHHRDEIAEVHPFDVAELVPHVSSAARRRIAAVVDKTVTAVTDPPRPEWM
jgi:Fic family protein